MKATRSRCVLSEHYFTFAYNSVYLKPHRRTKKKKANIFDSLPALAAPKPSELLDELDRYLSTDPEHVPNALSWWHERRQMYPTLSRMALDYLSIPGMYHI